jgi:hypothetical protein
MVRREAFLRTVAIGLIVADGFGGALIRAPERQPLAPARRKAVTLAFAQLVAGRLMTLDDPGFDPGRCF